MHVVILLVAKFGNSGQSGYRTSLGSGLESHLAAPEREASEEGGHVEKLQTHRNKLNLRICTPECAQHTSIKSGNPTYWTNIALTHLQIS